MTYNYRNHSDFLSPYKAIAKNFFSGVPRAPGGEDGVKAWLRTFKEDLHLKAAK